MRIVAKLQFVASKNVSGGAQTVANVIETWGGRKFAREPSGRITIRRSGIPADFKRQDSQVGVATEVSFDVLEPVSGGELQTQVRILETDKSLNFRCTLSLGSNSGVLTPHVDIRSPRFVKDIIALDNDWEVAPGAERVFAKSFDVAAKDVGTLSALIAASQRRLPIVVISEFQDTTLAGDIHDRVSADTCGLAHTCRLTREASWELTRLMGKEWSCYNGAIRLFWPFRLNRDDYRVHPLWTRDFLMRRVESEQIARDRFLGELRERLIEASTFVADNPEFIKFETARSHSSREAERTSVGHDYQALEASYAAENDDLRAALSAIRRENETLKQNVESLMMALRSRERVDETEVPTESPPETVSDAVHTARKALSGIVLFGDDIEEQLSTLNEIAGPPDKLLRYLMTIGELSRALQQGQSLGKSIPIWLRDQNVECSGESETVKASKAARARRTFKIDGQSKYCEYHAKPSDGVSPDMCVRIYFTAASGTPYIGIGYIGRHFD